MILFHCDIYVDASSNLSIIFYRLLSIYFLIADLSLSCLLGNPRYNGQFLSSTLLLCVFVDWDWFCSFWYLEGIFFSPSFISNFHNYSFWVVKGVTLVLLEFGAKKKKLGVCIWMKIESECWLSIQLWGKSWVPTCINQKYLKEWSSMCSFRSPHLLLFLNHVWILLLDAHHH